MHARRGRPRDRARRCRRTLCQTHERRAERAAGVARGGLDPDVVEGPSRRSLPLATQLSATPPARQRFFLPVICAGVAGHAAASISSVTTWIERREVHLALRERRLRLARRAAEELVEPRRWSSSGRRGSRSSPCRGGTSRRRAGRSACSWMSVGVLRLAVGREAHELVLAGVDLEAGEVGERRVEQAERVREADLADQLELVALADAERGRRPLADAVDGEDGRLLERRRDRRRCAACDSWCSAKRSPWRRRRRTPPGPRWISARIHSFSLQPERHAPRRTSGSPPAPTAR